MTDVKHCCSVKDARDSSNLSAEYSRFNFGVGGSTGRGSHIKLVMLRKVKLLTMATTKVCNSAISLCDTQKKFTKREINVFL